MFGSKVNGNTKTHWLKNEKEQKIATACVKSMQISLNEQWPLNLNMSMTIHIYRTVSWDVLTLSLHNDWVHIKRSHRQTHDERKQCAHFKSAEPDAGTLTYTCKSETNDRTDAHTNQVNSMKRRCSGVLIESIDNIHVSIVYMENGMHH